MKSLTTLLLVCGVAIACTVMYLTSDADVVAGGVEEVLAEKANDDKKVLSFDVEKAGKIITDVPKEGRMRLLDYLKEVEQRLASEVEGRKSDIANIRDHMARNRAYNAKARNAMKTLLEHRMAANAKQAKDDLARQMARTARTFTQQANLANERNAANLASFKKTRAIMRKNKRASARSLRLAVLKQQRALAALASKTNAHISRTNAHIAANAEQIRSNARQARKDLAKATRNFDNKMFKYANEAKAGRSRLAAESATMNKKLRFMISGKIKAEIASTAEQFRKVRTQMAKDRMHADLMLKKSTTNLSAALHSVKLLQDKRFSKTMGDIQAMKADTQRRLNKAKSYFKVNLLNLQATVKHQVTKLNQRQTQLGGVVAKNRLEQQRVNNSVRAEMKRMIQLGNTREAQLAKKDRALRKLQKRNMRKNNAAIQRMANKFHESLLTIRHKMKKNRAHASRMLAKKTRALYAVLAKNEKAQQKMNGQLTAATRRARLDAIAELRNAKKHFSKRLASMTATVVANDKKADKKIQHLAGVVRKNAIKSRNGRRMLRMMAKANKNELKTAVRNMISKGEARALALQRRTSKLQKKTRDAMNLSISMQISSLAKRTRQSISDLRVENKKARAQMRKQVLFAVKSAATLAKQNLKKMVSWSNKKFLKLNRMAAKSRNMDAAARKAMARKIKRERKRAVRALKNAVSTQNRALLVLKTKTARRLSKSNTRVDAIANQMKKNALKVDAQMKANTRILVNKVNDAKIAANAQLAQASAASLARHKNALSMVASSIKKARAESKRKFKKAFVQMAKNRAAADRKLAASTERATAAIAKKAALYDARFKNTVKDIEAARKAAAAEVTAVKKTFTTQIVGLTSAIKDQEGRLQNEVAVVSAEFASDKANQRRTNRKLQKEMRRIQKLEDARHSSSQKARGKLRNVIRSYRTIAKAERKRLELHATSKLAKLRRYQAAARNGVAQDLSRATKKLHSAMDAAAKSQKAKESAIAGSLGAARLAAANSLKAAKQDFKSKVLTLTNTVTASRTAFEKGLQRITKVSRDWKKSSAADRRNLKTQSRAMKQDLHRTLLRAIAVGNAKAKRAEERAAANIELFAKNARGELETSIERMADGVFKAINPDRQHIANNYLALKAYCGAASNRVIDYTTKGQGRGLSSVGDLLASVAAFSKQRTKPAEGLAAGGKSVRPLYGGKKIKVSSKLSKYNGLVNEYSNIMVLVRRRWPYGLGHYLLGKVQISMQKTGLLTYSHITGQAGKQVVVNGKAIGLSNRLADFDKLAVKTKEFRAYLTKLSVKLPKSIKTSTVQYAPPVWWSGN